MSGSVRQIRRDEVPAWCACPLDSDAWTEGERAWVARWHGDCRNLFAFDAGDGFLGKYDVPMEDGDRWTLWAPSVRDGDGAGAVMEALCAHLLTESRRRGIARLEVMHRARVAGASTYVGSTSGDNRPMRRLFDRTHCGRPRKRLVFRTIRGPALSREMEGP